MSVTNDRNILGGKPVISGTRISVEFIMDLLSSGWSYDEIEKDYNIKRSDIMSALRYATGALKEVRQVELTS